MAELGGILSDGDGSKSVKIEVEMLDFGYISECSDWKTMQAIVELLKSGKEGYYPDLTKAAEDKLVTLLPSKEKRRYLSLSRKTTPGEIADAENDLSSWARTASATDASLSGKKSIAASQVKGVRGQSSSVADQKPASKGDIVAKTSRKLGDEEDALSNVDDVLSFLSNVQKKKLEKAQLDLKVLEMSVTKRQYRANLEKTKGNESFKVGDNADAVQCYTKSLAFDPRNPLVWANRAMGYIRQELFDLAEGDASVALFLDPKYVKAYSRRGLVRFKRGKYLESVDDFNAALVLDPANEELAKLKQAAREKYLETSGASHLPGECGEDSDEEVVPIRYAGRNSEKTSIATEEANEVSIPFRVVTKASDLGLSAHFPRGFDLWKQGNLVAKSKVAERETEREAAKAKENFVRVNIISEDDSDSEEETEKVAEDVPAPISHNEGFTRVAISTDSDEEENEDEEAGNVENANNEEAAEAWKEKGNEAMKAGQLVVAVEHYSKSLSFYSTYLPALNNRAQAYLMQQNFAGCIKDCSAVIAQDPRNCKALYRRASAHQAVGGKDSIKLAVSDVNSILTIDPSNAQALQLLKKLEQTISLPPPPSATNAVKPVAAEPVRATPPPPAPVNVHQLKSKAQAFLAEGDYNKVISLLGKYLRCDEPTVLNGELLQDDLLPLLHLLASAFAAAPVHTGSARGDYEHAIAVYGRVLQLDAKNFLALKKRAELELRIAEEADQSSAVRKQSFEHAEEDIAAALKLSEEDASVLQLRQKLLNLRHSTHVEVDAAGKTKEPPAKPVAAASAPEIPAVPSTPRELSDVEKDRGNAAMATKQHKEAVDFYTAAIRIDASNVAAYNNRSLAYLKLNKFVEAEADASFVVTQSEASSSGAELLSLKTKALCRRGQARRSLGDDLCKAGEAITGATEKNKSLQLAQDKYREAQHDLQQILKEDPANKTALSEQKLAKEGAKRCQELLVVAINKEASDKKAATAAAAAKAELAAPRTAAQSVTNLLSKVGSPAPVSGADGFGMVARSTKKYNSAVESSSSTPVKTSPPSAVTTPVPAPSSSTKSPMVSPVPASFSAASVMNTAPTEPPKTVYELEKVWRALKGRPDLFGQYLACFKKSTFSKVFKDSISPELISFMFTSLRLYEAPVVEGKSEEQRQHLTTKTKAKVLTGYAAIPGFKLSFSVLPEQDITSVHSILHSLSTYASENPGDGTFAEDVRVLCDLYGYSA